MFEPTPSTAKGVGGAGLQMNVDRYEDVKMLSQSEPLPPQQLRGLANDFWQVRLYNFVFIKLSPPLQIPRGPLKIMEGTKGGR